MDLLPAGTKAPDFTLHSTSGEPFTLSEHQGKNVVLAFYPGDWTGVCGGQLSIYNEMGEQLKALNAEIIGISVDSIASHNAWAKKMNFHIELLSDFEPKGAVAKLYGAYDAAHGTTARALFVIDTHGVIVWSYLSPREQNPGADGILRALEQVQHG